MSKNGKLLFREYDPYITSKFGNRIHPITGVNTMHYGVDYGTNEKKIATYAIENGIVINTGYNNVSGNFVYVKYDRLKKVGLYQHLDRITVIKNQKVDNNSIIGYVGATGNVTGIHLHFGWFNEEEFNKGWYERKWEDFEKYDYIFPIKYLGNPTLRDKTKEQIEIVINNLRVRKSPNGEILGYIKPGIYNALDGYVSDYTWYKINTDMWIAYSKTFGNFYPKEISNKNETNILDSKEEKVVKNEVKNKKNGLLFRIFQIIFYFIKKILNYFKDL